MITVNSIVEFVNSNPDEVGLTMRVIEVNESRILVEYLVGLTINPTAVILLSDVRPV